MREGQVCLPVDWEKLRQVVEKFGLKFVALFGSLVKGCGKGDSDADIAVWAEHLPKEEGDLANWEMRLYEALSEAIPHGEGIDLVVLNRVESMLLFQVAKHGVLLYERYPGSWLKFKSYASRRYDDEAKFRRRLREYLRERYGK